MVFLYKGILAIYALIFILGGIVGYYDMQQYSNQPQAVQEKIVLDQLPENVKQAKALRVQIPKTTPQRKKLTIDLFFDNFKLQLLVAMQSPLIYPTLKWTYDMGVLDGKATQTIKNYPDYPQRLFIVVIEMLVYFTTASKVTETYILFFKNIIAKKSTNKTDLFINTLWTIALGACILAVGAILEESFMPF